MKNTKGITVIALIITIIILLILAGVTIATLTGENGLLKNAVKAEEKNEEKVATEKINLKITQMQIQSYTKEQRIPTLQELADELCEDNEIEYVQLKEKEVGSLTKITVGETDSIITKLKEYPYEFEIDSALRLASIDGIKISDSENTDNSNNSTSQSCVTIETTSPSASNTTAKVADYPEGFNMENCAVIANKVYNGSEYYETIGTIYVYAMEDGIYVNLGGASARNQKMYIILQKI